MARIIGIDLGTTNSCVAVLDQSGSPSVIPAADGSRTTPSMVAYTQNGVLVGEQARRQLITNPDRTIFGAKRLIGRKVNSPEVRAFARTSPFRIVAAPNGDAWIKIDEESKSPQEIAAHILQRLREIAEKHLGEPVTRAVVTVPAYFDEAQRQATRDAGAIAGLDIVRILNEPTAAALAYGAHRVRKGRRIIAVFDLGGGTFDISIMAVENDVFEVLATAGDTSLGGDDWDRSLVEHLADRVFAAAKIDLTDHAVSMSRLKDAAEAAKRNLSSETRTALDLPYLSNADGATFHLRDSLSRSDLDRAASTLLARLEKPCVQAMQDAGLEPGDIEEVLLVGGMTRTPGIHELVGRIFGQQPSKGANPDEVVALGAAAHAGILAGDLEDTTLLDVAAHTIGIRVGEHGFSPVIARNSMLPARESRTFATTRDDQDFVDIDFYEGESDDTRENRRLGHVRLDELPGGRAGSVRIELTVTMDVESLIHVTAKELKTGRTARATLKPSGGLSAGDIEEIVVRRRKEDTSTSGSS